MEAATTIPNPPCRMYGIPKGDTQDRFEYAVDVLTWAANEARTREQRNAALAFALALRNLTEAFEFRFLRDGEESDVHFQAATWLQVLAAEQPRGESSF